MADINQIQQLYGKLGSIREVARELGISRNTVRKHLKEIYSVQEGVLVSSPKSMVRKLPFK